MPQREITLKSDRIKIAEKSFTNLQTNSTTKHFKIIGKRHCHLQARSHVTPCLHIRDCASIPALLHAHVWMLACPRLPVHVFMAASLRDVLVCMSKSTCASFLVRFCYSACHSHPQVRRRVCMVMSSSATVSMSKPSIWMTYSHGSFTPQSKHHQKGWWSLTWFFLTSRFCLIFGHRINMTWE